MHLLISNPRNGKELRVRVGMSKNYLEDLSVVNPAFRPYLSYSGWWTFEPIEIENTSADVWILIQPGTPHPIHSLLFSFSDLMRILADGCSTGGDGRKHFYWYTNKDGNSFAARPLGTQGIKDILEKTSPLDSKLNLDNYVDAWQNQIGDRLK
jgi:hypothetical protein